MAVCLSNFDSVGSDEVAVRVYGTNGVGSAAVALRSALVSALGLTFLASAVPLPSHGVRGRLRSMNRSELTLLGQGAQASCLECQSS